MKKAIKNSVKIVLGSVIFFALFGFERVETLLTKDCGGTPTCNCACGDTVVSDCKLSSSLLNCTNGLILKSGSLDCNNKLIGGKGSLLGGTGIEVLPSSGLFVKNCIVRNFGNGILIDENSSNTSVLNSQIANSFNGIDISNNVTSSLLDTISFNTATNCILTHGENNTISHNNFMGCQYGMYFSDASNNSVFENVFINNDINAYETADSVSNSWNGSNKGNVWDDFESNAGYPFRYEIPGDGAGVDYKPWWHEPTCANILYYPDFSPGEPSKEDRVSFCLDNGYTWAGVTKVAEDTFVWDGNCRADSAPGGWGTIPNYNVDLTPGYTSTPAMYYDSDGGVDYYAAGIAGQSASGPSFDQDFCQFGGDLSNPSRAYRAEACGGVACNLIEMKFTTDGHLAYEAYNCPNGCIEGACSTPDGSLDVAGERPVAEAGSMAVAESGTPRTSSGATNGNAADSLGLIPGQLLPDSASGPAIQMVPGSLAISFRTGDAPQTVTVNNIGTGTLSWTATESPNVSWVSLSSASGSDGQSFTVNLNPIALPAAGVYVTKVRLSDPYAINSPQDLPVTLTILPPDAPSLPSPADGQTNVPLTTGLSWTGAAPGVRFDVYFGRVNPPAKVAGGRTGTTFAPGALLPDVTYYWKVVAICSTGGQSEGPVWSFATVLQGDINGDGYVNVGDLQLLVAAWGSDDGGSWGNWNPSADLNKDHYINVGDLQLLVANWGRLVN